MSQLFASGRWNGLVAYMGCSFKRFFWMCISFKVFIEFVIIFVLFCFFLWGIQEMPPWGILSPQAGIEPTPHPLGGEI